MKQKAISHTQRLQDWYLKACDGDWEHQYGISISSLDNPGWFLKVELKGTYLEEILFQEVKIQRDQEDNWLTCRLENGSFCGYGGPSNLEEILVIFLDWADERADQLK